MSIIEYRVLRLKVSQGIDWPTEGETILSLCEGFIAVGSENTIQNVVLLFAELERENNLGIDHLDLLKGILKGMNKWLLVDEIEKFKKKREAYTNLLEKITDTLREFDLQRLIEICFPHAQRLEGNINDVCTLFQELESQNRLTPDCVGVLKRILKEVRKEDLLKDVDDFEKKRKDEENADRQRVEAEITRQAVASAIYTAPRVVGRMMGAVNVHCNFKTVGGVVVAVGAGMFLYKYSRGDLDIQQFTTAFDKVVLPAATKLCAITDGSLCFTVQAESREALMALREQYLDGSLQSRLQQFLVNKEIKELTGGEEVILTVHIDEQEFNDAMLDLMMESQIFNIEEGGHPRERKRRSSDSVVYVPRIANESSAVILKLQQTEIKFHLEQKESLAKEIVKLKEELKEAKAFKKIPEGTIVFNTEKGDHPRERKRRNSDSVVYVPEKEKELSTVISKQTEEIQRQTREIVKLKNDLKKAKAFQQVPEGTSAWQIEQHTERPTRSRRRNSDSELYYKGKEEEVRGEEKKEERFLADDKYAFVQRFVENLQERQSLTTETSDSGIKTHGAPSELGMEDISDSVHKLCYKDLTEEVISELRKRIEADSESARLILQSFGITGAMVQYPIGNVADIFTFFPNTPVNLLKDVFEALQLCDLVELLEKPANPFAAGSLLPALSLEEIRRLRNTADRPISYHSRAAVLIFAEDTQDSSVKGIETFFKDLNLNSKVTVIQYRKRRVKTRRNAIYQLLGQEETLKTDMEREVHRNALMVIDEWIQRQDEFSFFAVFNASQLELLPDVIGKLLFGIPNKTKFVFGISRPLRISEALQVSGDFFSLCMLVVILNERWQTLDLVSMAQELIRRSHGALHWSFLLISIKDTLSSLPRFKRAKDLS